MNQSSKVNDELRPEYDFTRLKVVGRGPECSKSSVKVDLEPDVATLFPDSGAVNEGLRLLMKLLYQSPAQLKSQSEGIVEKP